MTLAETLAIRKQRWLDLYDPIQPPRHQWAQFAQIEGLKLLNLVQDPEVLSEAYEFFAPVAVQMHSWCGYGEPDAWAATLPANSRVVIHTTAWSRERAERLSARLRVFVERERAVQPPLTG